MDGVIRDFPLIARLMIVLGLSLVSLFVFHLIGMWIVLAIYPEFTLIELSSACTHPDINSIVKPLKWIQFIDAFGFFIVPSLVGARLISSKPLNYVGLTGTKSVQMSWVAGLIMICMLPAINTLVTWNESLMLPEFLKGLEGVFRSLEDCAMKTTKALLNMESVNDLLINSVLIAIIPAIGEELLFRGVIQKSISDKTGRTHLAVWVSAILFSALHLQFYGFFPRMFLGALLGYLFVWTGSLWYSIIGHFTNNMLALLITWYMGVQAMDNNDEMFESAATEIIAVSSGVLIAIGLIYLVKRWIKKINIPDIEKKI